jgi:hypothetical protein
MDSFFFVTVMNVACFVFVYVFGDRGDVDVLRARLEVAEYCILSQY